MKPVLIDPFGRALTRLRVSVTDRCNLNCVYCDREGVGTPSSEMTVEEVTRIVRLGARLGMTKVKVTGGEPLLRGDIVDIITAAADIPAVEEVSMVTNGVLLAGKAEALVKAGLRRVNVNLATPFPETYKRVSGGGDLTPVLEGVKEAVRVGLNPVKLNMVMLKGFNAQAVPDMVEFCTQQGTALQLIELHSVKDVVDPEFYERHHLSLDAVEAWLKAQAVNVNVRKDLHLRPRYTLKGGVEVEVVRFSDNCDFCAHCTRLRITCDGKIKPCLMRNDNLVDILTPMREGIDDEGLVKLFKNAVSLREPYQA